MIAAATGLPFDDIRRLLANLARPGRGGKSGCRARATRF